MLNVKLLISFIMLIGVHGQFGPKKCPPEQLSPEELPPEYSDLGQIPTGQLPFPELG